MKKNLIIGLLLGATLVAQASTSKELPWNEIPMTDALKTFNNYEADAHVGPKDIMDSISKYFNLQNTTIPVAVQGSIKVLPIKFADMVIVAYQNNNIQQRSDRLAVLRGYLDTPGKFIAKMYDEAGAPGSVGTYPAWITTEIALRGTTFGSEYRKEYFLVDPITGKKIDKEKNDGKTYYFYSEPTAKPGILRIFGLGYTDKRSWKKYLFEKVKYPALVGVLGYGAYKGAQTEKGKEFITFVKTSDAYRKYIDESGVEKFIDDQATTVRNSKVLSKAKEFQAMVVDGVTGTVKSVLGYFSAKDKKEIEAIHNQQQNNSNQINDLQNKKNETLNSIPVDENGAPMLTKHDENKLNSIYREINKLEQKNEILGQKEENMINNNASPVPTDDPEFKAIVAKQPKTRVPRTSRVSGETSLPRETRVARTNRITRRNQSSYTSNPQDITDRLEKRNRAASQRVERMRRGSAEQNWW